MKILKKGIEAKNASGYVELIPEEPEDMWHLYNIITKGDRVRATTIRKVQKQSNTGSISNERMKITLTIAVDKIDFDAEASTLRLNGRNVSENKFVKLSQHHTIELDLNRKVSISKGCWDTIFLERLEEATDIAKTADVAAVILSEGNAHICLMTKHMTVERQTIDMNIPKKRYDTSVHNKGLNKFFEACLQGIVRHVDFDVVKCLIIASPGFVREDLYSYMMKQAQTKDLKSILKNKSKILLVHSDSGHKYALKEVLNDDSVKKQLQDTKASGEVDALNQFYDMMKKEPDRAVYGPNQVLKANNQAAIDTLLVTDELFRSSNIGQRKKYIALVESVRDTGGKVSIFSKMHVSGEQLANISGVAAILRFPIPEMDNSDSDSDSSGDEK